MSTAGLLPTAVHTKLVTLSSMTAPAGSNTTSTLEGGTVVI